jgi:hypothetical protein
VLRLFTFAHRQYLIANAYKATMIASLAARDSSNSFPPSVRFAAEATGNQTSNRSPLVLP